MSNFQKYTTFLFDLDGTLIESNTVILLSMRATLEAYGYYGMSDEEISHAFIGSPLEVTFPKYFKPEEVESAIAYYRKHNAEHHDEYVTIFPYVKEVLHELKERGAKLAIVTSKRHEIARRGTKLLDIDMYFDAFVAVDHIQNPKPHQEPIEQALQYLNVSKEEACMIGDNSHDIDAAKNAEITSVGVAWSHKGVEYIQMCQPDFIIHDIRDLLQ